MAMSDDRWAVKRAVDEALEVKGMPCFVLFSFRYSMWMEPLTFLFTFFFMNLDADRIPKGLA